MRDASRSSMGRGSRVASFQLSDDVCGMVASPDNNLRAYLRHATPRWISACRRVHFRGSQTLQQNLIHLIVAGEVLTQESKFCCVQPRVTLRRESEVVGDGSRSRCTMSRDTGLPPTSLILRYATWFTRGSARTPPTYATKSRRQQSTIMGIPLDGLPTIFHR